MMQMDARQRNMLELMGISMKWLPQRQSTVPQQPAPDVQTADGVKSRRRQMTAPPCAPPAVEPDTRSAQPEPLWDSLDWVALQQQCAVFYPASAGQACLWGNHAGATLPVLKVPVMVVMDADYAMQLQQGMGAQVAALRLLRNMLAALDWQPDDIFITSWQRGVHTGHAAALQAAPEAEDVTRCDRILQRQAQLLGCRALLLLDPQVHKRAAEAGVERAAQTDRAEAVTEWLGFRAVCLAHPSQLLRQPAGKARAWELLCQLADRLSDSPPHSSPEGSEG